MSRSTPARPLPDPAAIDRYVAGLVAGWPRLTAGQKATIAAVLRPVPR